MDFKTAILSIVTFIYGHIQVSAEYWKSMGTLAVHVR